MDSPSDTADGPQPAVSPAGMPEWTALLLLPFGGLLIPLVGWLVGVVLLWRSRVWTRLDKLIGTLVVPGGYGTVAWLGMAVVRPDLTCANCGEDSLLLEIAAMVVLGGVSIAPIAASLYLWVRARHSTRRTEGSSVASALG